MMNKKTRIVIFVIVVIVLCLTVYLSCQIMNKQQDVKHIDGNSLNITNDIGNIMANNIITNNEIKIDETKNTVAQNKDNNQSTINNIGPDTKEAKEQAIQLVKDDWGDDSSVYYYVDEVKENGKYTVSIRDSQTTSVIVWYEVDLKNNTAVMQ